MAERTACSIALRLANVLEARDIPYAIGGALALGAIALGRELPVLMDTRRREAGRAPVL